MSTKFKEEMSTKDQDEMFAEVKEEISSPVKEEMSTEVHEKVSTKVKEEVSTQDKDEISTQSKQKASTKCKRSKHKGKGKAIHSKERGIIRNVLRFCDQEANMNALLFPLKKAQQRAAAATGVSSRTIIRIRKEAYANPPESKLRAQGKHRRKRKATQEDEDNPDSSKSKKPKSECPDISDTSSDDDDKSGTTDSCDPESDEDTPSVDPKWPPTGEYIFKEGRVVDINFFVKCLRRANSHHDTLPCNLNDLLMYEEASKNGILGIVFRCRVCLMVVIVWTQNPYDEVSLDQSHAKENTIDIFQRINKGSSSPFPMDLISTKMRNLPKFRAVNQSVQSDPPLIGWPQVATVDQDSAFTVSKSNPPLEPASVKATVAEMTFCIDQSESSPELGRVPVHSTDHSISPIELPKSTDTSSEGSLKGKTVHSARLKNQSTAKLVSKKSKTSDGPLQRPLKPKIGPLSGVTTLPPSIDQIRGIVTSPLQPRIGQFIGVRVPSSQPRLNQSTAIMVSTMQPKLIQASAAVVPTLMASAMQPRLVQATTSVAPTLMASTMRPSFIQVSATVAPTLQPRLMASTTQPRLFQASGKMASPLQPRLSQSSAIMVSTMQPRPIQASATVAPTLVAMASTMQPRLVQASSTVAPTLMAMASTMQPRLVQASTTVAPTLQPRLMASTTQPRFIQASGKMASPQPRILQSSGAITSPTGFLNSPILLIQRPLRPQNFQSSGPGTPSATMVKPEQITQTAQRPLQPRFMQTIGPVTSSTAMVLNPSAQRPLSPRIVQIQPSSLRFSPSAMLKSERIIVGQDVFVQRPLQPRIVGSTPDKILIFNDAFARSPLVPGAKAIKSEKITITPDVFPHRILPIDSAPSSGKEIPAATSSVVPETIISNQDNPEQSVTTAETLQVDLNLVKKEVDES